MAAREWKSVQMREPDNAGVAILTLNRPSKFNAVDPSLFEEIPTAIQALDLNSAVRVIIVNAAGPHFCAGIDLSHFGKEFGSDGTPLCLGRQKEKFRRHVKAMQDAFNAFEECRKPVIAAIHGACVGAGIDMVTACDLRYCTQDAVFSVMEVDVAITADLGTLQRLPKLVGHGNAMELALTGRRFSGSEAKSLGLVHGVFQAQAELDDHVQKLASEIAAKSPLAVMGTKTVLIKSRDMTVAQGLEYVGLWNAAMLASEDLQEALQARVEKVNALVSVCEENGKVAVGATGGLENGVERQPVEAGEDEEAVHVCAQETQKMLPKRKTGRSRKPVRVKIEESEAGKNWPDSEVYALIDVRGGMDSYFVKNAKKQGVNSWSNLHARMVATVQGFSRTPVACKRKFNSLYKQYKDCRIANNDSDPGGQDCKFYACLDNWWHVNESVVRHVSFDAIDCTPPLLDNPNDNSNSNVTLVQVAGNKCRKREIQSA